MPSRRARYWCCCSLKAESTTSSSSSAAYTQHGKRSSQHAGDRQAFGVGLRDGAGVKSDGCEGGGASDAPAAAGAGTALNALQMLISLGVTTCTSTEACRESRAAACLSPKCTPRFMWVFGRRRADLAGKEPPAGQPEREHAAVRTDPDPDHTSPALGDSCSFGDALLMNETRSRRRLNGDDWMLLQFANCSADRAGLLVSR